MPQTKDQYIQQANDRAKQGYAIVTPTTEGMLSYKPNTTISIEYKALDENTNDINVLNDMGKQGYLFKSPSYDNNFKLFDLYMKNTSSPKTYEYQAFSMNDDFLTQANEAGKNGWRYLTMLMIPNPQHLYVKDGSNVNYQYATEPDLNSIEKLREQITNRAKDGWVYRGGMVVGTTHSQVFEKASNQSQAISCDVVDMPNDKVDINVMNDYAKKGYLSLGKQTAVTNTGMQSTEIFCSGLNNVIWQLSGAMLP